MEIFSPATCAPSNSNVTGSIFAPFGKCGLDPPLEIAPTAIGQAIHIVDVSLHINNQDRVAVYADKVIALHILLSLGTEKFHVGILAAILIHLDDIQVDGIAETFLVTPALDEIVIKPPGLLMFCR